MEKSISLTVVFFFFVTFSAFADDNWDGLFDAQFDSKEEELFEELGDMDISELIQIKVTSVSRKEENLSEAAAAIFVITEDDISRSGANSIPDLLRIVPGLHVAQNNNVSWAITARGFNGLFANKLLV